MSTDLFPDDPIFFDPDSDTPQLMPQAKHEAIWEEMLQAMVKADISPAIVYATRKTNRIVTEQNMKFLSAEDLAEWDAAIAEYEANLKKLN